MRLTIPEDIVLVDPVTEAPIPDDHGESARIRFGSWVIRNILDDAAFLHGDLATLEAYERVRSTLNRAVPGDVVELSEEDGQRLLKAAARPRAWAPIVGPQGAPFLRAIIDAGKPKAQNAAR